MITPENFNYTLPSGFSEYLPGEKRLEKRWLEIFADAFEQYGFAPIETPAVERIEVLQAKGQQGDNIIYGIKPLIAEGEQHEIDRGLKFDQTVPLAAYIARHKNELSFPFARYQMDMVFRGERPGAGRYRQFRQCDIDVVGRGELDLLYDAQMPAIIAEIFTQLDIGKFQIKINNRKVLTGFFTAVGIAPSLVKTCINIVDEFDKIGVAKVQNELEKIGVTSSQAQQIIDFTQIQGSPDKILAQLQGLFTESIEFQTGVAELTAVTVGVRSLGVAENNFCIDLSIARGLGYYTGTVYETFLLGYESLGSVCSGGRYEDLVGIFVGEKMPGVGISIGLTRLLSEVMTKRQLIQPLSASPAQVMVLNLDSKLMDSCLNTSQILRRFGINVLTAFGDRKVGDQFKQAEKLGIPLCVLIGDREIETRTAEIKVMKTGEKITVAIDDLIVELKHRLA